MRAYTRYPKTCELCGRDWLASKPQSRTCSPKCRAILRERETPSPGHKREYPPELVAKIVSLYESGMTVLEIRKVAPKGCKVQLILERYLPERRRPIKRDQAGENNDSWKGDDAGYTAAHLRIKSLYGAARDHLCSDCGNRAHDWSYQGGAPDEKVSKDNGCAYSLNADFYRPRCIRCHRRYDLRARRAKEVMPDA